MEVEKLKAKLRTLVANYMSSEGCSCCQNIEQHEKDTKALAKVLDVPMYDDKSGYDFYKFKNENN